MYREWTLNYYIVVNTKFFYIIVFFNYIFFNLKTWKIIFRILTLWKYANYENLRIINDSDYHSRVLPIQPSITYYSRISDFAGSLTAIHLWNESKLVLGKKTMKYIIVVCSLNNRFEGKTARLYICGRTRVYGSINTLFYWNLYYAIIGRLNLAI